MSTSTVISAASFVGGLGVNVHMAALGTSYGNVGAVLSELQYLGISTVRDQTLKAGLVQTSYGTLAAAGVHFDMIVTTTSDLSLLDAFQASSHGAVVAVEGPNEINITPITYNGLTGNAAGAAFMSALVAQVQGDAALSGVKIFNLSAASSVVATTAPIGNLHVYPGLGGQPLSTLNTELALEATAMPGVPTVITEAGYNTVVTDTKGVDYATQAKLTLNVLMDAAKAGVASTYLYELSDQLADPNNTDTELHYGLFDSSNSAKPVATAIHNLTSILADPAANAASFVPTALNYTITGLPSSGSTLALGKVSGAHDLVIWAEPQIWDSTAHAAIAAATQTVNVDLGATYATVTIYDPLTGTTPISTLHNVQSVQLGVTDHPLIIETGPDLAGAAPVVGFTEALTQDTGASSSDLITRNGAVTLTGIASAGAAITVKDGATVLGSATASGAGAWSLNATLGAGSHQLSAVASLSGLSSTYVNGQTLTVVTAATAPTVTSVTGAGATIASGGAVYTGALTVQGLATAGYVVTVYADGVAVGVTTAAGNGQWSFDDTSRPLAAGLHAFTATALDVAGNTSPLSTSFGVNVTPPNVSLAFSLIHDNGVSTSDFITNNGAVTTSGTTSAGALVVIKDGATVLGATTANINGLWSFITSVTGAGSHQLSATATLNSLSTTYTNAQTILIDTTAPATPMIGSLVSGASTLANNAVNPNGLFVINGSAEANALVTLSLDGVVLAKVTTSGAGQWTYDDTARPLSNGAHSFTASAMDVAGNLSGPTSAFNVTVSPPAPSVAFSLSLVHDNGSSASDFITNNGAIRTTGTATAGSQIVIKDGATVFGSTTADVNGAWSFNGSLAGAGNHQLSATATLSGVSTTYTNPQVVLIDTTAPVAPTVSNLVSGGSTLANNAVNPNGLFVVNGVAEASSRVTVYADGVVVGTVSADVNGLWTFDDTARPLTNGAHAFSAIAMDVAGNLSTASSAFNVTVSPPAPSVTMTFTLIHDNGISASDSITNNGAVQTSGTATAGSQVVIKDGATSLGTTTADVNGLWSFTTALAGAGNHQLSATATLSGVSTTYTNPRTVLIDLTAPAAPVISGLVSGASTLANNAVNPNGLFMVNGSAEANAVVTLALDGTTLATVTANAGGQWSYDDTARPLTNGAHAFTAVAMDVAGNLSSSSTAFNVTVSPPAPSVAFTFTLVHDNGPSASDFITNNGAARTTGTATAGAQIVIRDGATVFGSTTADVNGLWSFNNTLTGSGVHQLSATATLNGVSTTYVNTQVVVLDTTPPAAPVITSLVSGTMILANNAPNPTGVFVVRGTAEANATVTVYADGTAVGSVVANASGQWSYDDTARPLANGTHAFTAIAADLASNVSTASSAFNVTVNPLTPTVGFTLALTQDTGSAANDFVTNNGAVTVTGTATAGSQIVVKDGATILGTVTAGVNGAWTFTGAVAGDGAHQLSATATSNGLSATYANPQTILIDTAAPNAPTIANLVSGGVALANNGVSTDGLVVLHGATEANALVTVSVDGTVLATVTADAAGQWAYDDTGHPLANGAHVFTAVATDPAGNTGAGSSAFNVTVSPPPPSIAFNLSLTQDTGSSASDFVTRNGAVTVTGTATIGSQIVIKDGATVIGAATADVNGQWSFSTTLAGDGARQLSATATLRGVSTTYVNPQTVLIDTTAPSAPTIANLVSGGTVLANNGVSANGLVVLSGVAEANALVRVYLDGTSLGVATADVNGQWTYDDTARPLVIGAHAFTVIAADAAGNTGVASPAFNVSVNPSVAFTLSLTQDTGSAAGDFVTKNGGVIATGTATVGSQVTVKDGATVLGTVVVGANGQWSFSGALAGDGSHQLAATATLNGVSATYVNPQAVVIDTTAPAAPTIANLVSGGATLANNGVSTNGLVVLHGATEANALVTVYADGASVATVTADSSGQWAYDNTANLLFNGAHAFTAVATDVAGNTGTSSGAFNVIVNLPPPTVAFALSLIQDSGSSPADFITQVGTVALAGTATAGSQIVVKDGAATLGTATADLNGLWSFNGILAGDGIHQLSATASLHGVSATYANPQSVLIDTAPPSAPTIANLVSAGATLLTNGVSSDGLVVLHGATEANALVTVYLDGTSLGVVAADAGGQWTFDDTSRPLTVGAHAFTARASDIAGNTSLASSTFGVTVAPPGTYGGAGDDIIVARDGYNDTLDGAGGVNTVSFASIGRGVTVSLALQGAAQATGAGSDILAHFQNLTGSAFADTLTGDLNANVISGGGGNDIINGGGGNDTLTGGAGADTFIFSSSRPGQSAITDFSHAQGDRIDLTGVSGVHTLGGLQGHAAQSGSDTLIAVGGIVITLTSVNLSDLAASDFIFAPNHAPTVAIANHAVAVYSATPLTNWLTYADVDADAAVTYRLWDDGQNGDYISTATNPHITPQTSVDVAAADLANVVVHGGGAAGVQTFWVQAYDGLSWSAWTQFTLTTTVPVNHAPVATLANQTVASGSTLNVAGLITYSDADGDAATQYRFWDGGSDPTSGFFSDSASGHEASGVSITVSAANLSSVVLHPGTASGTETMWVQAYDGKDWGAWSSFTLTSTVSVNHAPTIAVANQTLAVGATVNVAGLISYADADSDAAVSYRFWDGGSDPTSGFFSDSASSHEAAGVNITVSAANLSSVVLHPGTVSGTETMWVQAYDGKDWGAWSSFTLTSTVPVNHAPVATLANQTLAAGSTVNIGSLITYSDADSDAATQYRFWDGGSDPASGYFSDNASSHEASGVNITVSAANLSSVVLHPGTVSGTETMWVQAYDGKDWGAWSSFTLTSTVPVNHAPTVSAANHTAAVNSSTAIAGWLTYADADSDAAVTYRFWDGGQNGGYISTAASAHVAAQTNADVAAADLGGVMVHGGAAGGTQTLWVQAYDGHDWGAWTSFTFTTAPNHAPVATIANQTLAAGATVNVAGLIGYSDADGDLATQYHFWDSGAAPTSGYFSDNASSHEATGVNITVAAANLNSVVLHAGSASGSETLWVQAYDGHEWGAWSSFTLLTA